MSSFALVAGSIHVQTQALGIKVELVPATILLENLGDVTSILDLPKLDVTLALLDSVTNKLGRAGLTLCADNEGLLFLASLIDHECRTLSVLLSDLFGFDSGSEFGREGQVLLNETLIVAQNKS